MRIRTSQNAAQRIPPAEQDASTQAVCDRRARPWAWEPVAKVIRAGERVFYASSSLSKLIESPGIRLRFSASTGREIPRSRQQSTFATGCSPAVLLATGHRLLHLLDFTRQLQQLEEKFDPEMRFRPTVPPAVAIVKWLLIALSCFHYYTAGFGLLRETTHRGVHLAFVLGLIFLVFAAHRKAYENPRPHSWHNPGGVPLVDWALGLACAASGGTIK